MVKYIECEAAYRFAQDQLKKETGAYSKGWNNAMNVMKSAFHNNDAIPAADVAPVRHGHKVTHNRPIAGHWVSGELDGGWDGMEGRVWVPPLENNPVDYCSECGKRLDDTFQKYCPNCGAKMDKDGDGE